MRSRAYSLPFRERRRIYRRAYRAQQQGHHEVCGLIIVRPDRQLRLRFLPNLSSEAGHYVLDLAEAQALRVLLDGTGERLLGSFHSHPVGYARPGPGDRRRGFYRGVELINGVCGCEARLWRRSSRNGRRLIKELPLVLERASQ